MMHDREKSYSAIVAAKPTNKAARTLRSRWSQGRRPRGTRASKARTGHRTGKACHRRWTRTTSRKATEEGEVHALLHHISIDLLQMAFFALKRDAAPGVDGMTWQTYEADLDRNLTDLHSRVHRGTYRALPSRRTYIPKADGKQRPLAVAALEDKIVQRATVAGRTDL